MNTEAKSILDLIGLPTGFGVTLLVMSLALFLAPYLAGYDFGAIKIPKFPSDWKRRLKWIGPIVLCLMITIHIPFYFFTPGAEPPPHSTDLISNRNYDTGYIEGKNISEKENEELKSTFNKALKIFKEDRDYELSKTYFINLSKEVKYNQSKENLIGLTTASYYGAGQHREGIKFICDQYKDRSKNDIRYRFEIHAHIRKIALIDGYKAAESFISRMHNKYDRDDLSFVWIGVPLGQMEYLKAGYLTGDCRWTIAEEDIEYLKYVIKRYPDDPFIDHAYYFIGKSDFIINNYKNSIILPIAYLEAARNADDRKSISIYKNYIKNWPKSDRVDSVERNILERLGRLGEFEEFISFMNSVGISNHIQWYESYYKNEFLKRLGFDRILEILFNKDEKLLLADDEFEFWSLNIDEGDSLFSTGNFNQALIKYKTYRDLYNVNDISFPSIPNLKINHLENIITLKKDSTAYGLLKLAFYLRDDVGKSFYASWYKYFTIKADAFQKVATKYPYSIEAEKALYLLASLYRSRSEYDKSYEVLKEFKRKYPRSYLIDDIIAEMGLYNLFYRRDFNMAKNYFDEVISKYPQSNAADNSLNWIAWSYLQSEDYVNSAKYYGLLGLNYANTRIGKNAVKTYIKMQEVLNSKYYRNGIDGLNLRDSYYKTGAYISKVVNGSTAYRIGLRRGDIIINIDDYDIESVADFNNLIENYNPADICKISIIRGSDNILVFRGEIVQIESYKKTYY